MTKKKKPGTYKMTEIAFKPLNEQNSPKISKMAKITQNL